MAMKSKATTRLRNAIRAWFDERTIHIITKSEEVESGGGCWEGQPICFEDECPAEESGQALV
jgi:hypothetical protein